MAIQPLYKGYRTYEYSDDVSKFLSKLDADTRAEVVLNLEDIEATGIMPEQIGKRGKLYERLDCKHGALYEIRLRTKQKEEIRIYFHPDSRGQLIVLLLTEFKQGRPKQQDNDIKKACRRLREYTAQTRSRE